ncbi:MAG TPA: hypothetical protein VHS99_24790, partial [Chloroflexota bacterium]|nr:hypothetical protein [Chloroflexota bacterium]
MGERNTEHVDDRPRHDVSERDRRRQAPSASASSTAPHDAGGAGGAAGGDRPRVVGEVVEIGPDLWVR